MAAINDEQRAQRAAIITQKVANRANPADPGEAWRNLGSGIVDGAGAAIRSLRTTSSPAYAGPVTDNGLNPGSPRSANPPLPYRPIAGMTDNINPVRQAIGVPRAAAPAQRPIASAPTANAITPASPSVTQGRAAIPSNDIVMRRSSAGGERWSPEQEMNREASLAAEREGEAQRKRDYDSLMTTISANTAERDANWRASNAYNNASDVAQAKITKGMPFWQRNSMSNKMRLGIAEAGDAAGRAAVASRTPRMAIDPMGAEKLRQSGIQADTQAAVGKAQIKKIDADIENTEAMRDTTLAASEADTNLKRAQAENYGAEAAKNRFAITPEGQAATQGAKGKDEFKTEFVEVPDPENAGMTIKKVAVTQNGKLIRFLTAEEEIAQGSTSRRVKLKDGRTGTLTSDGMFTPDA